MSKCSPAPWVCSENGAIIYSELKAMSNDGGVAIICMKADPQEAVANRMLISATPDLLAACEWAARSNHHPACLVAKAKSDHCTCHVGAARAAIAKATQEVPQ